MFVGFLALLMLENAFRSSGCAEQVAFSADGKVASTCVEGKLQVLWEAAVGELLWGGGGSLKTKRGGFALQRIRMGVLYLGYRNFVDVGKQKRVRIGSGP